MEPWEHAIDYVFYVMLGAAALILFIAWWRSAYKYDRPELPMIPGVRDAAGKPDNGRPWQD